MLVSQKLKAISSSQLPKQNNNHSTQNRCDNLVGILTSLATTGVAWAGIDTKKCWGEPQDQGGIDYLRGLFLVVQPIIGLVVVACTAAFPIRGERLRILEQRQQQQVGGQAARRCGDRGGLGGEGEEGDNDGRLDGAVDLAQLDLADDFDVSHGMLARA